MLDTTAPENDASLFGRAASSLALVCMTLGRQAESIRWASRALEVAGTRPTVDLIARQSLMQALAKTGRTADALALVPADLAVRSRPSAFDAELLAVRADVLTWCGDTQTAVADARTVVRWAHAGTAPNHLANCYVTLAEAEQRAGLWDDAVGHVELAASLIVDTDHRWAGSRAHAIATGLYACRGDWEAAAAHLQRAVESAVVAPFPESQAYRYLAEASLAWARRDWTGVLSALALMRHPPDGSVSVDDANISWWRLAAAEASLATRALDEAQRLLDEAEGAGGAIQAWVATRARIRAALCLARGDAREAETAFAAAAHNERARRAPFDYALLSLEHGRFLANVDRRDEALPMLERARDDLRRLRARPFVALADTAVDACGTGKSLRWRAELLDQLTGHEQIVVRLVADGLTNREVAAQLYISAKTVEYHLAHVFAKLQIHSRRQLRALPVADRQPAP